MSRTRLLSFIGVSLSVMLVASVANGWTAPTLAPPNGNIAPPINTSASGQVKTGDFATLGKIGAGTAVPYANFKLTVDNGTSPWTSIFVNQFGNMYFGPANATWNHIYTDNAAMPFIFNTDIFTTTNSFSSYNGNLLLKTSTGGNVGTTRVTISAATGAVTIGGTITAPSLLDSNDASYYVDPNGVSILNDIRPNIIYDRQNTGYYVDPNGSSYTNYFGRNYGYNWTEYDWNNAAYYIDPNNASIFNDIRANVFYDYANTGYYMVPRATSRMNSIVGDSFYYASDRRLKDNIVPIASALSKLMQITGVTFDWNSGDRKGEHDIGVIAQDVESVLPEAVMTNEEGMKAVDYPRLVPLLVNAIKDQQSQIDALRMEIEAMKSMRVSDTSSQ